MTFLVWEESAVLGQSNGYGLQTYSIAQKWFFKYSSVLKLGQYFLLYIRYIGNFSLQQGKNFHVQIIFSETLILTLWVPGYFLMLVYRGCVLFHTPFQNDILQEKIIVLRPQIKFGRFIALFLGKLQILSIILTISAFSP